MTTLHSENIESSEICPTCGSDAWFFSKGEPPGHFCIECGTPDSATQVILMDLEPGVWV